MPNPAAQLAPTGKLRVAIAIAPSPSAQFAIKDEAGNYRDVANILGQALAKKLGVPVELISHNGSGEIQNSAADNKWDVAFLPVDEERKKFVDFGNAYHLLQSTYLVGPSGRLHRSPPPTPPACASAASPIPRPSAPPTRPRPTPPMSVSTRPTPRWRRCATGKWTRWRSRAVAHRAGAESARFAHSRRRLFEFHHLGGGAEGQAGIAGLRHRVHRGGESLRPGAPSIR
jgi:hypothetical protein